MQDGLERIPLFPLNMVVFPDEPVPLHIFEERYKEMVAWCITQGEPGRSAPFGILLGEHGDVRGIGCTVYVREVLRTYDDGKLDISTVGERRFTVMDLHRDRSFTQGSVQFFDDAQVEPLDTSIRERAIALHVKLLELVKGVPPNLTVPAHQVASFYLAHFAGLENIERQTLLEMRDENARLQYLVRYYERVIPVVLEREDLKARVNLNGQMRQLTSLEW